MYPHRIRLRGPWDYEVLTANEPVPEAVAHGRMIMPCRLADAGLRGFAGTMRLVRRFGMPRSLDANEHVWLDCAAAGDHLHVELNQTKLGDFPGGFSVEVTPLLRERNECAVCLRADSDQAGLFGETALEIRMAAFLRNCKLQLRDDGRVQVGLQLVSQVETNLELYLIVARHTVAYRPIRAVVGTTEVELVSDDPIDLAADEREGRVELVQGPIVWYSATAFIS